MRQLVEWQRDLKDDAEFLESVKVDLFPNEVFVFTPKGKVQQLPFGATPVDFAYTIHSDVGTHCMGARVNGKIVPLKYQLRSGETVEILISPNQKPSKDWLKFAKTSRAKTKIRQWFKTEEMEKSFTVGKEILEKELRKYDLHQAKLIKSGDLDKAAKDFSFTGVDDLIAAVGYGKITVNQIVGKIFPQESVEQKEEREEGRLKQLIKKVKGGPKDALLIKGVDNVMVRYAGCCNPLPGDKVVGFITRGRGVTIHTSDCRNAMDISLEGQTLVADVVETYVPIMSEGKFMGAFEIYYNVTNKTAELHKAIVRASIIPIVMTVGGLLLTVIILLQLDKTMN